jgi:hypothetical protein
MTSEFKRNLARLYGGNKVRTDVFGRRKASPAEIQRATQPNNEFESMERYYPPTGQDIATKIEGLDD